MRSDLLEDVATVQQQQQARLLAKKSSYQAWKCVSFACSLLALLLLLAKWQEISSDLQLLLNFEHLVSANSKSTNNNTVQQNDPPPTTMPTGDVVWPPPPGLLAGATGAAADANSSLLVTQHMHISVGRELQGNQLLRKEIATFTAEFRGAKSIISLSSLLVSVYIISWILMTLAINDARISNDISLRNILLLSVFGAIDLAASLGFVLVRLIMYSVKNNSFRGEMLTSTGFRDAPLRLAPDQLTAFTALRLIAMRSCSAYMDIYVSFIVVLLTVLRLYAIVQALAYYRHLRRSLASIRYFGEPTMLTATAWGGGGPPDAHLSPGGPTDPSPKQVWSIFPVGPQDDERASFASRTTMISGGQMSPHLQQQQQIISQHPRYSYQQQTSSPYETATGKRRPPSRNTDSWQPQPQPQPQQQQPKPVPPQRRAASEQVHVLTAASKGRKLRKPTTASDMLESRSPSPKFQYTKRQRMSDDELLARRKVSSPIQQHQKRQQLATNTLRGSDGQTYTLLSANQLERISRKLFEAQQSESQQTIKTRQPIKTTRESNHQVRKRQQQQQSNNNFELLLTTNATATATADDDDERSTESSSLTLVEDDDLVDSDSSQNGDGNGGGGDSTGDVGRRRIATRRPDIMGGKTARLSTAGYLIQEETAALRKTTALNNNNQEAKGAKNKLLLGEYFYA